MNKTRVIIIRDDIFSYRLMDSQTVIDFYGEDYLQDYGLDVPIELVNEYKAIMQQYKALEDKLRLLYHSEKD